LKGKVAASTFRAVAVLVLLPLRTAFIIFAMGGIDLSAPSAGFSLPRSPAGPSKYILELAGVRGAAVLVGPPVSQRA